MSCENAFGCCFFVRLWSEGQPSALFWSINFNTLIFEAFLRFLITQDDLKSNNLVTPTWSKNKAVNLRGWGPIPGLNAFEFNTRYRIKKVSRNLLNPNSAIGHSKFMCWIWIVFRSIFLLVKCWYILIRNYCEYRGVTSPPGQELRGNQSTQSLL